jgi:hypothetical protein
MQEASFWSFKFGDLLMIAAVGFSPLVAVALQKWFERVGSTNRQRHWIFQTLMSTRSAPLDLNHVQALNMITLDFRGKRFKQVRRCWEIYLRRMVPPAKGDDWNKKRGELLANLLVEMGRQLGFKFDTTHVTDEVYRPQYYFNVQQELDEIRGGFLEILRARKGFPVHLYPLNPEGAAKIESDLRSFKRKATDSG